MNARCTPYAFRVRIANAYSLFTRVLPRQSLCARRRVRSKIQLFKKTPLKKTIGEDGFEAAHPLDPSKLWKLSLHDPLQQFARKFSRAYIYFVPLERTRVERDIYELVQGL